MPDNEGVCAICKIQSNDFQNSDIRVNQGKNLMRSEMIESENVILMEKQMTQIIPEPT